MKLLKDEFVKVQYFFPNLFLADEQTIKGELNFCACYKKIVFNNISKFVIESCKQNDNNCIEDVYSIEIELGKNNKTDNPPKVFETEGRIENLAISLGKTLNDLHLNEDKSCCLGIFSPSDRLSLCDFVLERVYPYFVWQAYFAKHREIPPCGECSHDGQVAINSRIKEEENNRKFLFSKLKDKPTGKNRNKLCSCGSGKKYKKCCLESDREVNGKINKVDNCLLYFKNLENQGNNLEKQ